MGLLRLLIPRQQAFIHHKYQTELPFGVAEAICSLFRYLSYNITRQGIMRQKNKKSRGIIRVNARTPWGIIWKQSNGTKRERNKTSDARRLLFGGIGAWRIIFVLVNPGLLELLLNVFIELTTVSTTDSSQGLAEMVGVVVAAATIVDEFVDGSTEIILRKCL
jgi:hypothetical protein